MGGINRYIFMDKLNARIGFCTGAVVPRQSRDGARVDIRKDRCMVFDGRNKFLAVLNFGEGDFRQILLHIRTDRAAEIWIGQLDVEVIAVTALGGFAHLRHIAGACADGNDGKGDALFVVIVDILPVPDAAVGRLLQRVARVAVRNEDDMLSLRLLYGRERAPGAVDRTGKNGSAFRRAALAVAEVADGVANSFPLRNRQHAHLFRRRSRKSHYAAEIAVVENVQRFFRTLQRGGEPPAAHRTGTVDDEHDGNRRGIVDGINRQHFLEKRAGKVAAVVRVRHGISVRARIVFAAHRQHAAAVGINVVVQNFVERYADLAVRQVGVRHIDEYDVLICAHFLRRFGQKCGVVADV